MNKLRHLGIIMDGNGRWAQLRKHPRAYGHIRGAKIAKDIITQCAELKIEFLTLYTFSTENWLRPHAEISLLMRLLQRYLLRETQRLVKQNIRLTAIGDLTRLPDDVFLALQKGIRATEHCTGMNLSIALSYGSKDEIISACKRVCKSVKEESFDFDSLDEKSFGHYLQTYPAPDVDLLIRTSGEKRLSNFLLWQSAYAELFFSDYHWPDFNELRLQEILNEYSDRHRRFGQLGVTSDEKLHS